MLQNVAKPDHNNRIYEFNLNLSIIKSLTAYISGIARIISCTIQSVPVHLFSISHSIISVIRVPRPINTSTWVPWKGRITKSIPNVN